MDNRLEQKLTWFKRKRQDRIEQVKERERKLKRVGQQNKVASQQNLGR